MKIIRKVIQIATGFLKRKEIERGLNEELEFHLQMATEQNVQNGMDAVEARRQARLSFGGMEGFREECRETRAGYSLERLLQDIGFAFRIIRKNPGYSLVVILTLSLGIGANTAIFSMVYAVLLKDLPYAGGSQLVVLSQFEPGRDNRPIQFSVKEIEDYRAQSETLEEIVEFHDMEFTMLGRGDPQQVATGVVSANFFDVLGIQALQGRTFLPGEDQPDTEPILVLSHSYWVKKLGRDPDILGQQFELNQRIHTVVGVLPDVPQFPVEVDIYMPVSHCPTRSNKDFTANRNARMMQVFGRLQPAASVQQANDEMDRIASNLKTVYPENYDDAGGYGASCTLLKTELSQGARPMLLVLLAGAGFVLLIACANVANLSLSRALRREQEMSLRMALGAGRSRILHQVLTESLILSLLGGLGGLLLGSAALTLLIAFAARFTARAPEISLNPWVLLFTLVLAVAAGIFFGIAPAFRFSGGLAKALGEGAQRSTPGKATQRVRYGLAVTQVAVSLILLAGAGLMFRTLTKLQQLDPGFRHENILTMRIALNFAGFDSSLENRLAFFHRLLDKLHNYPGIQSVAAASAFPLSRQTGFLPSFQVEGRSYARTDLQPSADRTSVTPSYFETLGIPLLQGRSFRPTDDPKTPPEVIISANLARRQWPDADPIGSRISFNQGRDWATIVGVAGDARQFDLAREPVDQIYVPFWRGNFGARLLVRTAGEPHGLASSISAVIREMAPDQTIDTVATLEEIRSESLAPTRLVTILIGLFAGVALLITITGIGGILSLMVSQRRREIGIRMALGATRAKILRIVMGQGLLLVSLGLILGIAGASLVTHFLSSMLFGVAPHDPATIITVSLILLAAALITCFVPAHKATRVDPNTILKVE